MSMRGGVLAASLFALTACGAPAAETTAPPAEESDTQGGETTGTVPSDDLVAVPVYGIAVPPEQVPDDSEEEGNEDPQAEGEGFEPAPDMQPMARYGMAPVR